MTIKRTALLMLLFHILLFFGEAHAKIIKVVTSTCSIGEIAKFILRDIGDVISLADGRFDLHRVEPRPQFLFQISKADYVIPVGMDLDGWFISVIEAAKNPRVFPDSPGFIVLSRGLEILEIPTIRPGEVRAGDIHPEGNPHYWLSPENAERIAEMIADVLTKDRRLPSEKIKMNLDAFKFEIGKLKDELTERFVPFKGAEVIAYHNSWRYLEKFLGFKVVGFLEPAPGIPPTPSHLQRIIELVRSRGIKVIIYEPFHPESHVRMVSEKTRARAVRLFQDCVPKIPEVSDYFSLMRYNVQKLADGLK